VASFEKDYKGMHGKKIKKKLFEVYSKTQFVPHSKKTSSRW